MAPPPTLPAEVRRFLLWLEKTEGRDKLYRLVVYGSKWLVHSLQQSTAADPDTIKRIRAGASVVATSRKRQQSQLHPAPTLSAQPPPSLTPLCAVAAVGGAVVLCGVGSAAAVP